MSKTMSAYIFYETFISCSLAAHILYHHDTTVKQKLFTVF